MSFAESEQKEMQERYEASLALTASYTAASAAQRFGIDKADVYGIMYSVGVKGFNETATLKKAELIRYLYETANNEALAAYYDSVIEAETKLNAGQILSDPQLGLLFSDELITALFDYYGTDPASDSLTQYQILRFVSESSW